MRHNPLRYLKILLPLSWKKVKLLDRHNWYRNMVGGWVHPHCMDFLSHAEIATMSVEELEYALKEGSMALKRRRLEEKQK